MLLREAQKIVDQVNNGAASAAPIETDRDHDPSDAPKPPANERLSEAAWTALGRSLAATDGHAIRQDHLGRLGTKLAADGDVCKQDEIVQKGSQENQTKIPPLPSVW